MGYTTDFRGEVTITPPLNAEEIDFFNRFNRSRRMDREEGPYFAEPGDNFGQDHGPGIRNFNQPPAGQPGLWCGWTVNDAGTAIEWDGGEKFYSSAEWMTYIIDHFLKPGAIAANQLPFLQANHTCEGVIEAQGEDPDDRWRLVVTDNAVKVEQGTVVYA